MQDNVQDIKKKYLIGVCKGAYTFRCKSMKAHVHLQRCRCVPKVSMCMQECKHVSKDVCVNVSGKKVRDKSVLLLCLSFPLRNVQGR